jgi:large repetitive protein
LLLDVFDRSGSPRGVATGGTKPYTWSIVGGSLPPGLTMNGNGVLSGKPTTAGTYGFTVRATAKFGNTGDAMLELTVS